MSEKGQPQILSMKMKTFDADMIKDEMMTTEEKSSSDDKDSPDENIILDLVADFTGDPSEEVLNTR